MALEATEEDVKIIKPGTTGFFSYLVEVWRYRVLVFTFAKQELKTQYAQTLLGFVWAVLRPLMIIAIFTFIFDKLIKIPGLHTPYPLFALSGLIAWNYFSFVVSTGGSAVLAGQQLIKKVYFPKVILPIAKTLVGLVEFSISFLLMLVLMLALGYQPGWQMLLLPIFIFINLITGLTVAIWLNALNVRFRDINQFVPQLIGFLIWLTPVFYPGTLVPPEYSFVLYLNPLAGIIQGYRYCILMDAMPTWQYSIAFIGVAIAFVAGLMVFIKAEDQMADYL